MQKRFSVKSLQRETFRQLTTAQNVTVMKFQINIMTLFSEVE